MANSSTLPKREPRVQAKGAFVAFANQFEEFSLSIEDMLRFKASSVSICPHAFICRCFQFASNCSGTGKLSEISPV